MGKRCLSEFRESLFPQNCFSGVAQHHSSNQPRETDGDIVATHTPAALANPFCAAGLVGVGELRVSCGFWGDILYLGKSNGNMDGQTTVFLVRHGVHRSSSRARVSTSCCLKSSCSQLEQRESSPLYQLVLHNRLQFKPAFFTAGQEGISYSTLSQRSEMWTEHRCAHSLSSRAVSFISFLVSLLFFSNSLRTFLLQPGQRRRARVVHNNQNSVRTHRKSCSVWFV